MPLASIACHSKKRACTFFCCSRHCRKVELLL